MSDARSGTILCVALARGKVIERRIGAEDDICSV